MLKKVFLFLTVIVIGQISAQNVSNCTYTLNSWNWEFDGEDIGNMPNVTIHDPVVAAAHPLSNVKHNPKLTLKAGDVICMDGSIPQRFLTFKNIISPDSLNPIIIKNINGQVIIRSLTASYGWKFKNSKYFKILGNGDPAYKYGFKVTTHNNSYIQMIDKTTDFEIAHVEVAGDYADSTLPGAGFVGIMAKSQPICWDDDFGGSTDRGQFEMQNVYIHHNYIHGVGGEGMYVGYGRAAEGVLLDSYGTDPITGKYVNRGKCSVWNQPHDISNLHIYNNIVENVGWDGIQVKNTREDAYIYNNVVKNYATKAEGHHDEGILVGDGTEAEIYGNWIENGTVQSNGMQINAYGNTKIYNNVILGSGSHGIYINNNSPEFSNKIGTFEVYNNTIEGGVNPGIIAYTPQAAIIKNNIVFGYGTADTPTSYPTRGIKVTDVANKVISSNLVDKDVLNMGLMNVALGDVRLASGSLAIDAGESITLFTDDYKGSLRTDGNIDIGAIEKNATINNIDINLSIDNPFSNNVTIMPGESVSIMASLTDVKNKVKSTKYVFNANVMDIDFMPNEVEYVIPSQVFLSGNNTFYIETTLYGGETFLSTPITINNQSTNQVLQWTGATDSDWGTAINWSNNVVPTTNSNVLIPGGLTRYPIINNTAVASNITISPATSLIVNSQGNLTVEDDLIQNGSFVINSDVSSNGSLILKGTQSGSETVTYNRNVTSDWHLLASPVVGQSIPAASIKDKLLVNGSDFYSIAPYNNTLVSSHYTYYTTTAAATAASAAAKLAGTTVETYDISYAGNFISGKGYSVKRNPAEAYFGFSGNLNTSDVSMAIIDGSATGNKWNLVGNPFTASINGNSNSNSADNFLTVNTAQLDPARVAMYVWNAANNSYDIINQATAGSKYIAPGQGFFVESKNNGGTLQFTEAMQSHQTGNIFQRTNNAVPSIKLMVSNGASQKSTAIKYFSTTTTGLDAGYDAGIFSGDSQAFNIFTKLVSNDNTTAFGIQSLPTNNYESMVIPVGINAITNTTLSFSIASENLPTGINVYLEDRLNNTFTQLNTAQENFTTTIESAVNGVGRFYLHTRSSALGVDDDIASLKSINIYKSAKTTLTITGLTNQGKNTVKIFNIIGKEVLSTSFEAQQKATVQLPVNISKGVYIVKLETVKGNVNKKIILN
jgi:hypothetical protein